MVYVAVVPAADRLTQDNKRIWRYEWGSIACVGVIFWRSRVCVVCAEFQRLSNTRGKKIQSKERLQWDVKND